MAEKEENFEADDTYEEIEANYSAMEANADDENDDEGTVEYLDLDMEIGNFQQYCPDPDGVSVVVQSSVLKANQKPAEPRVSAKYKTIRAKPSRTLPERSIMRTRSSNRAGVKRKADCPAPASVHDAVNSINAKLADSAKCVNGRDTKNFETNNNGGASASDESVETDSTTLERVSSMDGLDLFFRSMAQTVLGLPSRVQAKIKMDICKVIASAEIKYRSSENCRSKLSLCPRYITKL